MSGPRETSAKNWSLKFLCYTGLVAWGTELSPRKQQTGHSLDSERYIKYSIAIKHMASLIIKV